MKDHGNKGTSLSQTIADILFEYKKWRQSTFALRGRKSKIIAEKVKLFDQYGAFLDTEAVDKFDSRGALVSSALEEFCYYLLKPLLNRYPDALLGKQDVYQGLYFTAGNFRELLELPLVHTPVNTLDFIIGARTTGTIKGRTADESFAIRLPAVAIECKGYLDRPRFIESETMARRIKSAFPQCMYLLVAQSLKLDTKKIGVATDIDGIYVWRRMQNIDRKERRAKGIALNPHHADAVEHFYDKVENILLRNGNWLTHLGPAF